MRRMDQTEAERLSDYYGFEAVDDDFFRCKHGTDLCEMKCLECDAEVQDALRDDDPFWPRVDRETNFTKE